MNQGHQALRISLRCIFFVKLWPGRTFPLHWCLWLTNLCTGLKAIQEVWNHRLQRYTCARLHAGFSKHCRQMYARQLPDRRHCWMCLSRCPRGGGLHVYPVQPGQQAGEATGPVCWREGHQSKLWGGQPAYSAHTSCTEAHRYRESCTVTPSTLGPEFGICWISSSCMSVQSL